MKINRNLIRLLAITALTSSFVVVSEPVYSQHFPDQNSNALKDVDTFDARFMVVAWLNTSQDKNRFVSNGQSAFELALRRDGVIVDDNAPNYLFCTVSIAESTTGLVFYTWSVEYFIWNPEGIHILAWKTGGIATVGSRNFNAQGVATDCADGFANAWLAENPKSN